MHLIVQACILGILVGGVYALMASGLTLVFGIMRVVNVAQGAMVILGAYLSYSLFVHLHIDPFASIVLVGPAMFVLGVAIHRLFIRTLRSERREELSLLVTWATALAVEGVLYSCHPGSHYDLISRLLSIIVLGGLGSLGGAIVASLILGVAESVVAVTISPIWSSFAFFVVLIGILLFRPQGLFGVRERGA